MATLLIPFNADQPRIAEAARELAPLVNGIRVRIAELRSSEEQTVVTKAVLKSIEAAEPLIVQQMAEGVSELDYA